MKDREFSFSPEKNECADEFHTGAGEFHRTIGKSRAGRRETYGGAEEFYDGAGEFHDVPDEHTTYRTGDEADDNRDNEGRRTEGTDAADSRHKNIKKMMLAPIATVAATVSIVFSSYNVDPLGSDFLYANESGYEETLPSESDKPNKPDRPDKPTEPSNPKPDKTKDIRVGDIVYFGSYEQDNDTSDGAEQIEWRVLDVKDGNALLLSMYGLDAVMYHSEDCDITWDGCSLRNIWMDNFYKTAFTKSERKAIVPTKLKGEGESAEDTTDNVFALSVYDIENYFGWGTGADCKKYATPYAKANGVYTDGDGACNWWLRSPGFMGIWAANVEFDGSVNDTGSYVMFHDYAACPAVWVDIKSGVLVLKERGEGGQVPSTAETTPQETEETSRWQWPTKETEPEETTQSANKNNFPNLPNMEPLITGEEFIRLEAPADDPEAVRYILNGGNWGWYDDDGETFHPATVEKVKGISYDDRTNTLTLNNYTGGGILNINQMGNGFTIEVKGDNYIDVLEIWGWFYGGSVTITGKGTLTLNKDMEYNMGIAMWAEQSQTCLRVDDEVTLDVYGSAEAIWIEQTLMSEAIYYRSGKTFVDGVQGDINCYTDVMDEQSYAGEPLYICTVSDNYGTGFATHVKFAPEGSKIDEQPTVAYEEPTEGVSYIKGLEFPVLADLAPYADGNEYISIVTYFTTSYIMAGDAYMGYDSDGNYGHVQLADIPGISYDAATNTLTLKDYYGAVLEVNQMGNGFTINVVGDNYLQMLNVKGGSHCGSVTITGSGTLTIAGGGDLDPHDCIQICADGSNSCIMIDDGVTLILNALRFPIKINGTTMREAIYYRSADTYVNDTKKTLNSYYAADSSQPYDNKVLYNCYLCTDDGGVNDTIYVKFVFVP